MLEIGNTVVSFDLFERCFCCKLSECKAGETVILSAVIDSSDEFLTYLNHRNLSLNSELKILEVEKFDQSMKIEFSGKTETLSEMVCNIILVQKI